MVSMQKICFWLGVFAVALLVMVQPARADTVPQVQAYSYGGNYLSPTPEGVCALWGLPFTTGGSYGKCVLVYNTYGGVIYYPISIGGSVCPANTTTSGTTCTCNVGYVGNGTSCVLAPVAPVCPAANTVATSGLFDIGTNLNKVQPGILNGCGANNCATSIGSLDPVSRKGIIGGQTHYFSVGVIVFTGETCAVGAPSVSTTTSPNIQQSCGSGETAVTGANNFFRCYKDSAVTGSGSSSVPVTTTQTTTGTTTTTDPSTGASSVTTSTTVSETITTGGGTSGAAAGTPADPLADYCATTPTAEVCKQSQPAGTVSTPAVDGLYNGDLNAIGHKTVSDVVGSFKTRVLASPVGSATSGFFNVSVVSGTCPVWSADVPMIGVMTFDAYCVSWFQNLLPWIKSVLMIVLSVAAFRIAIL